MKYYQEIKHQSIPFHTKSNRNKIHMQISKLHKVLNDICCEKQNVCLVSIEVQLLHGNSSKNNK